jgi:hypothetical protein
VQGVRADGLGISDLRASIKTALSAHGCRETLKRQRLFGSQLLTTDPLRKISGHHDTKSLFRQQIQRN